jgi:lipopolysaccharide export system protein LptA
VSRHLNSYSSGRGAGAVLLLLWIIAAGGPARAQALPALPIEIRDATRVEYDDATGVARAEGSPAVITRGTTVLRALRLQYNQRSGMITADGGVELNDPDLSVRADTAAMRLADDWIHATGDVHARSSRNGQVMTLVAPDVEGSLRNRRFSATGGVTVTRGEWTLAGQRLDYDDGTQVALVRGEPKAQFKDTTMTAQIITLFVADETARAEGTVVVRRGNLVGTAPRADVFGRDNRAVLSGGARVDRGSDRIVADVIEIDLDGTRVTARGASQLTVVPP